MCIFIATFCQRKKRRTENGEACRGGGRVCVCGNREGHAVEEAVTFCLALEDRKHLLLHSHSQLRLPLPRPTRTTKKNLVNSNTGLSVCVCA